MFFACQQVMPYSTGCCTPLSNFEAGLNYKDVSDPAVMVRRHLHSAVFYLASGQNGPHVAHQDTMLMPSLLRRFMTSSPSGVATASYALVHIQLA